ncbi:MAG: alpha-D-glucose phosphate-specific phosphoglucomutase [Alphaproteobacteria bacterium]|nr:alpha-D-glucose phosphate-specific phosphoglucomutase [Alphaproteobacteria bacterium]
MQIQTIQTTPYTDQKPGTSGLRKKTKVFLEKEHYLQNFIQSIFDVIDVKEKRLVVGGDGRYFNEEAIQIILKMAIANEALEVIVGQNGFMSTPAVSVEIRQNKTDGGIILSASHNPGGIDGDFGIKYDGANGAPAPESITNAIYQKTLNIDSYKIAEMPNIDLSEIKTFSVHNTLIKIINPVANYANLMEQLFDFNAIRNLFKSGFKMHYDALHAITGPYAKEILENRLGAPAGTVVNGTPLPDFGGGHPDPNLTYAKELVDVMYSDNAPDMGAASDGDGDRNMVLGNHFFVNPSDSIAILADNADVTLGYAGKVNGVARSMPTSKALDKVAEVKKMDAYEVPTGWKFFANLMDDNRIVFCGEESFGAGSNHIREKDGLWAVLFWLNILAVRKMSVEDVVKDFWNKYGRYYYSRYDYEGVDADGAKQMMDELNEKLPTLKDVSVNGLTIENADVFDYVDPVTQEISTNQGIRITFTSGERVIFRTSGTGTQGATIRIYLEKYISDKNALFEDAQDVLAQLVETALQISRLPELTGRKEPSVIT